MDDTPLTDQRHRREHRPPLPDADGHPDHLHAGRVRLPGGGIRQGQEHHQHPHQELLRLVLW